VSVNGITSYEALIARKAVAARHTGIDHIPTLNGALFPFQRDVTEFLLRCGRGAAFLDTGLGKTLIQLEWARVVSKHTSGMVLILVPLAVAQQTKQEAKKFGIEAAICRHQADCRHGINIANYERLHLFDPGAFAGVVLDESSILKSFTGKTTRALIEAFSATPYRLCCTATPAPNDHMELGNHADFLGVMPMFDMLTRWFVHDSADTKTWRLKGHAGRDFWNWVASWARCLSTPSDLGYADDGFVLPALNMHKHQVQADRTKDTNGALFRMPDTSATAIHKEKRLTTNERAELIASLVDAEQGEPWVIWCDTNYEADKLVSLIPEAIEIRGSMPPEIKESRLVAFSEGKARIIITKPSIAGFGLNWQHCARMAFVGLSFSYESFYQAVRRCWRFGQGRPVEVHVAMADTERAIWDAVSRKSGDHSKMKGAMAAAMARASKASAVKQDYRPSVEGKLPPWMGT
jgi:hypothetical protein